MFATSFPAAAFDTNCYVLAPALREECVVVDPGIGVEARLAEVLSDAGLRPAAVLLTHGHLDHVYAVTPVCGAAGVAAYIHDDDRYRLSDPVSSLSASLVAMFEQQFGPGRGWREPDDVVTFRGADAQLSIAGLTLSARHAPGHTEGSVVFGFEDVPDELLGSGLGSTVVSGDVVFAGSVGRTDLPGGDAAAMQRTLREVILGLPDDTLLLPGHGPASTMARERATNPFLRGLAS